MSMSPCCKPPDSRALEFAGILRNRLEAMPNKVVALEIKVDASHVGKVLAGTAALKLDDVGKLLALSRLKVVDDSRVCVRQEEIDFLRRMYTVVCQQAPHLLNEGDQ